VQLGPDLLCDCEVGAGLDQQDANGQAPPGAAVAALGNPEILANGVAGVRRPGTESGGPVEA
jgi:hypothetical protein